MKFRDLKVGDLVFVVHQHRRFQDRKQKTETLPIIKMGRKYGYIEKYGREAPFCLETGHSSHQESNVRSNGYGFDVYLTEAEYHQEQHDLKERSRLQPRLVNSWGRLHDFRPEVIAKIHAILDAEGLD